MKKKNRRKLIVLIIVILIVIVFVVMNMVRDKEKSITVQTEKIKRDFIVQTVNASGSLIPVTQVKISGNVSARIMNITVEEGDTVKSGDLLVELDRAQYEAAFERARSVVESNKANRRKIRSDLKRTKALYNSGLASEAELEAVTAQMELAESQVLQAEAAMRQALDDLSKTSIVSPMDGIVTDVRKEIGEIALGSVFQEDVILVVSDLSKMEAKVEVDETDVVSVEIGDTTDIEIDAIPDTLYKGLVTEIAHSATIKGMGTQEQVTNFEVEVTLIDQEPRIRPGMSATVDIITDVREDAVVVPIQCLTVRLPKTLEQISNPEESHKNEDESKNVAKSNPKEEKINVVFIVERPVDENGNNHKGLFAKAAKPRAVQRPVKIGISSDTHFEILEGLDVDEEIVVGSYKAISKDLKDGSALKISSKNNGKGK